MALILIIEDDATVRKTLEYRLKREQYEVHCAENGLVGLKMTEELNPDVIVCDNMLPFLKGGEVIYKIRNELKLNMPIIMLTAVGTEASLVEAYDLGADDFITKPFQMEELVIKIRRFLRTASK